MVLVKKIKITQNKLKVVKKLASDPMWREDQKIQLILGVLHGLKSKQINFYGARITTSSEIMEQLRLGFEAKISMKKVEFYFKPRFSAEQMKEAWKGFKSGLSIKKVAVYYKEELNWYHMEQARLGFEAGLSVEDVKSYCSVVAVLYGRSPEFTVEEMEKRREELLKRKIFLQQM